MVSSNTQHVICSRFAKLHKNILRAPGAITAFVQAAKTLRLQIGGKTFANVES